MNGRPTAATGDAPDAAPHRAANELTPTVIDPCSKQPAYKTSACRIERLPG